MAPRKSGAGGRALVNPPGGTGRRVGRPKKNSPETFMKGLEALKRRAVYTDAIDAMGICFTTWDYWLAKSEKGQPGDGFDLEINSEVQRWHVWVEDAKRRALDKTEGRITDMANGEFMEILTNRDGVIYEMDDWLLELGYTGRAAYKRDQYGDPIPVKIPKFDVEAAARVLRSKRPEVWGEKKEVNVTGGMGVLVVGAPMKREQLEAQYGGKLEIADVEFEVIEEGEPDGTSTS
jgi:hypothetical protein